VCKLGREDIAADGWGSKHRSININREINRHVFTWHWDTLVGRAKGKGRLGDIFRWATEETGTWDGAKEGG